MNLIITNQCNIRCPFCFASESKPEGDSVNEMTLETFWGLIDKFKLKTARFCGGEPTVHPDFVEMLDGVLEKDDMTAFVMTNGIWPDPVFKYLRKMSFRSLFDASVMKRARRVSYLFNLLNDEFYSEEQKRTIDHVLGLVIPDLTTFGGFTASPAGSHEAYPVAEISS